MAQRGTSDAQYGGSCDKNKSGWCIEDQIRDNEIVEGEHVSKLTGFFKSQNWGAYNAYIQKLRDMGFGDNRITSMVTRSTIKLPKGA